MARLLWRRVHLWLALIVGLVFALFGATGALLVVKETLLAWEIGGYAVHVAGRDVPHAPVAAWLAGAGLSRPMAVAAPRTGFLPTDAAMVIGMGEGGPAVVMVDPWSGDRLALFRYDGSVLSWVVELHRRLMLPQGWGFEVVAWCGMALLPSLVSGVWLWWPRHGRWRIALIVGRASRGPRLLRELHNVAAIYLLVPLVLLTVTGIALSKPGWIGRGGMAPPGQAAAACAAPAGPDQALATALALVPGARLAGLNLPRADGVYTVRLAMADGGEAIVRMPVCAANGPATVEQAEGRRRVLAALHADLMLGRAGRIIVAAAGLALPVLYVTGIWMWWRRRAIRPSRRRPAPP